MIAAIYARKSTEQHDVSVEERSVARQVEHARAYAACRAWTVLEEHVYSDDGISGAEFDKRPGLVRLMNALRPRPPFQVLIMSEESRLGREQIETAYALKQLITAGVRVFFYLEDRERTLDSPSDKLLLSVTAFADELERDKARQRTRDALIRKARQGHVTGGTVFGYQRREVRGPDGRRSHVERVVHPAEAAIVRQIFELCAAGKGLKGIAVSLNEAGAPAPLPRRAYRPRAWSPSSVREILYRELYRGVVVWGQTRKRDRWGIKKSTTCPPNEWVHVEIPELRIVSEDLWQTAHERLRAARRFYERATAGRPAGVLAGAKYLLSGLASCGARRAWDGAVCGGALIVRSRASSAGRRYVYACGYHHTRGRAVCDNALLAPMEVADRAVIAAIDHDVFNPRVLARAADHALAALCPSGDTMNERRERLLVEMRRLEGELARLADAIAGGGDVPVLVNAVKEREAQRARCERELATLDSTRRLPHLDRARLDSQVRETLTDWQGLLGKQTAPAREILRNVLAGRLIFTPTPEERVYTFTGQASIGRLLAGAVPAWSRAFNSDGGPNGIGTSLEFWAGVSAAA